MRSEDVFGAILIVLMLCSAVGFVSGLILHQKGYLQGVEHAKAYYQSTNSWPSRAWLEDNEGKHDIQPGDIEDWFKPY